VLFKDKKKMATTFTMCSVCSKTTDLKKDNSGWDYCTCLGANYCPECSPTNTCECEQDGSCECANCVPEMDTIKCNTEELKVAGIDAYSSMLNATLDEYEANMRERFCYDEVNEDYIEECRYYEVNMRDNTEDEVLEAIGKERNALTISRVIMKMIDVVYEFDQNRPEEDIGKLYTLWRYVVTEDVQWEIEEE